MTSKFSHERHKPPATLARERGLVLALPAMRSNVNLSRIVRAAACFGISRIITCGSSRVDRKIARDGIDEVEIETHRSLEPVLRRLSERGFQLVGLEQATNSSVIYDFEFAWQSVLVVGHERYGITEEVLAILDHVVEIPVHGLPYSHNAATSAVIAMYEYCRQFPTG